MGGNAGESDILKSMITDTNPILLVITAIVSVLHSVFDMLAFKNDIAFFKKKKSMVGLSIRTMIVNTFFQVIIFLYLMDNDTSFMILMSNGMGLAIEVWKVLRACKFSYDGGAISWGENEETEREAETKEYVSHARERCGEGCGGEASKLCAMGHERRSLDRSSPHRL